MGVEKRSWDPIVAVTGYARHSQLCVYLHTYLYIRTCIEQVNIVDRQNHVSTGTPIIGKPHSSQDFTYLITGYREDGCGYHTFSGQRPTSGYGLHVKRVTSGIIRNPVVVGIIHKKDIQRRGIEGIGSDILNSVADRYGFSGGTVRNTGGRIVCKSYMIFEDGFVLNLCGGDGVDQTTVARNGLTVDHGYK